jgi:L-ascorbate metabolism protein UlaG (beta-lactamase superfamily)
MKITKFEHAFLVVEQASEQLLIDPGIYSPNLPKLENVVGIVLTHLHDDHSYLPHITKIKQQFPNARIFGPRDVAAKLGEIECEVVTHSSHHKVGEFALDFFGDQHQEIHRSIPLVQNVGVLVNSKLYYPGDSYTQCEYPFEMLACPSAAPWMKISDLIDYLEAVKPKLAFATHNAILNDNGHALQNNRIREIVTRHGGEFSYLTEGESLTI